MSHGRTVTVSGQSRGRIYGKKDINFSRTTDDNCCVAAGHISEGRSCSARGDKKLEKWQKIKLLPAIGIEPITSSSLQIEIHLLVTRSTIELSGLRTSCEAVFMERKVLILKHIHCGRSAGIRRYPGSDPCQQRLSRPHSNPKPSLDSTASSSVSQFNITCIASCFSQGARPPIPKDTIVQLRGGVRS